jgi:hypothetical protein
MTHTHPLAQCLKYKTEKLNDLGKLERLTRALMEEALGLAPA